MAHIDLQHALREWPHDPEQVSVRKILGEDGTIRIQTRVELGILQMEVNGRPDGTRPHGCDTLLTFHQRRLLQHEEQNGTNLGFALSPVECLALRLEASHFYRRFVAFFVLEEYMHVLRDTSHTLAVFDFNRQHAFEADDRFCMESYRPYVLMMEAKARAFQSLAENEPASALAHVNRGILQIKCLFEDGGRGPNGEACQELKALMALSAELAQKMPGDSLVQKQKALREALAEERFEEAARLRDAIHNQRERRQ